MSKLDRQTVYAKHCPFTCVGCKGYNLENDKSKESLFMKQFTYTVKDPVGIHARPAGLLAKKASEFKSKITFIKNNKRADTRRIMMLMSLGIKHGDIITVEIDGEDETSASEQIEKYLIENKF